MTPRENPIRITTISSLRSWLVIFNPTGAVFRGLLAYAQYEYQCSTIPKAYKNVSTHKATMLKLQRRTLAKA